MYMAMIFIKESGVNLGLSNSLDAGSSPVVPLATWQSNNLRVRAIVSASACPSCSQGIHPILYIDCHSRSSLVTQWVFKALHPTLGPELRPLQLWKITSFLPWNDCFDIIDLFFSNKIISVPSDTQSWKAARHNAVNILPQTAIGFPQILTLNLIMTGIQSRNRTSTDTHRGGMRRLTKRL